MPESDQSTATQRVNEHALEGLSTSDDYDARENFVQNDQAVRWALTHETDALTTGVRDVLDAKAATLPPFTGREQNNKDLSQIFDFPTLQPWPAATTFHALQEWEGYVLEISDTDFVARLVDLTTGSLHEEEEADIPLTEISDKDSAKMRPGSVFRWVIGYERSPAGTKKRVSHIVFRDLPVITKSDLRDGELWAGDTIRSLKL